MHTATANAALLGLSADIHLNPVVKLADTHIFAADVVFDIGVEQMYQKISDTLTVLEAGGERVE